MTPDRTLTEPGHGPAVTDSPMSHQRGRADSEPGSADSEPGTASSSAGTPDRRARRGLFSPRATSVSSTGSRSSSS